MSDKDQMSNAASVSVLADQVRAGVKVTDPPGPPMLPSDVEYLGRSLAVAQALQGMKGVEIQKALGITAPRLSDMKSGRRPIAMELLPAWKRLVGWRSAVLDFTIAFLNFPDTEVEVKLGGRRHEG